MLSSEVVGNALVHFHFLLFSPKGETVSLPHLVNNVHILD